MDFKSASPKVDRVAYTEGDIAYKIEIMKRMRKLGMSLSHDDAGNICGFLQARGQAHGSFALVTHTDSITVPVDEPNGGAGQFDGAAGMVAYLMAIENLQKQGVDLRNDIYVVNCACEESSRFASACIGSRYLAGSLEDDAYDLPDKIYKNQGITLGKAMHDAEGLLESGMRAQGIKADKVKSVVGKTQCDTAFELHIEQYESLVDDKKQIGIVTAIPGAYRFEATMHGKRDHSGATPVEKRQDSMRAMRDLLDVLYKLEDKHPGDILVNPAGNVTGKTVTNMVQNYVHFPSIDVRIHHPLQVAEIAKYIEEAICKIEENTNVQIDRKKLSATDPCLMDAELAKKLHSLSQGLGFDTKMMRSGAGHDIAYFPARRKGLIFIPSTGGSHNPQEHTTGQDILNGTAVLEKAITLGTDSRTR